MPIKVLVISDYRVYHSARPEAEIFIGLADRGYEIHIMTFGDCAYARRFRAHGIHVIDWHPEKKFNRAEIARIRDTVRELDVDILHLFNNEGIVNGLQAARGLDVKVVLYRGYAGNIHWWDPTAYTKFLNPRVDKIVCNAKGVEEVFQRQLFFDRSKAITINKGHDLSWYAGYKPVDIRSELGIPKSALLLVNVAMNRRMKGIPYLLKAMNLLPREAEIHLLLIGKNMDTPENLNLIRLGHQKSRIHILGFQKEPMNIVSACDAFVLSSIKGESLTMSVIEAIAVGMAPVITDIPGNRKLVVDKVGGLVVPPRNPVALSEAIMTLYNDRSLIKKYALNAQQHIRENINHAQTVNAMDAFYQELVNV